MTHTMLTLHVLSAVGIGFYLLLPFATATLARLTGEKLAGFSAPLVVMNRIGQYILVVAFLTGGYLISKYSVSTMWWILAVVLILAMFAFTGIMSKPLKSLGVQGQNEQNNAIGKLRTFSLINAVVLILIVLLMMNPGFLQ